MILRLIRQNYAFFVPYAVLLIAVGLLLAQSDRTDLMRWVNDRNHPYLDRFFYHYTDLADGVVSALVVLGLLFVRYRWALLGALCFLLSGEVTQLLKHGFFDQEMRPSVVYQNSGWLFHTVEGLDLHARNSFPSGHSTSVFALFCFLTLIVADKRWGWLFLFMAALAAYSRVYLFQHFVADVYAGSLIGTGTTLLVYAGLQTYWQRNTPPWLDKKLILKR